jgi:hypothetical protein
MILAEFALLMTPTWPSADTSLLDGIHGTSPSDWINSPRFMINSFSKS